MFFAPILATLTSVFLGWALFLLSLFLILLILVQRGRGGGLAGALGGPGGQSAFGTKAGDLFTRITAFVSLGWIALCAFTMWMIGSPPPTAAIDRDTPAVAPSPAERSPRPEEIFDFGEGVPPGAEAPPAGDIEFAPPAVDAPPADEPAPPADTPAPDAPPADAPPALEAPAEPSPPAENGENVQP